MAEERNLIIQNDPKAIGSEAFRTLRTNLQFVSPDRPLKTILMTSAGPGEGKSTVSANLAVAVAQTQRRVVLVGCDLRRPVVHEFFPVGNAPGLTGVLTGQVSLQEALRDTEYPGLRVLPAGPIPPNPAELLQSAMMEQVVAELAQDADMVLFDGAPVISVTDSAILASRVDGVLLVAAANKVPREAVLQAKSLLEKAQARILGVVLNGIRPENQPAYYYYNYYSHEKGAAQKSS